MIFLQFYQFLHYFGVWLLGKYKFKYFPGELNPYFLYFEVILFISRNAFDFQFSSVHFSSSIVSDSCDSIDCSTPGLPVHHQHPEFTQTHVHWVDDTIQPSHPLSSPSPPAFNLSQHQGLFKWVSSSQQVAKVLEFQLQHQSLQWTPRTDLL